MGVKELCWKNAAACSCWCRCSPEDIGVEARVGTRIAPVVTAGMPVSRGAANRMWLDALRGKEDVLGSKGFGIDGNDALDGDGAVDFV